MPSHKAHGHKAHGQNTKRTDMTEIDTALAYLHELRNRITEHYNTDTRLVNETISNLVHARENPPPRKVKRFINIYVTGPGRSLYNSKANARYEARLFGEQNFGKYLHTVEIEVEVPA